MELCFKLLTGLLLLIQACRPTLLQNTIESTGRPLDRGWLRDLAHNGLIPTEEGPTVRDQEVDEGGLASTGDVMTGLAMGSMILSSGEEEVNLDGDLNGVTITNTSWPPDETHTGANGSSAPASPNTEVTTQQSPNSSTDSASDTPAEVLNSTTTTMVPSNYTDQINLNSSTSPKPSNATDLEETTLAPETHETNETREPDLENTDETTSSRPNISTTAAAPESSAAPSAAPSAPLPTNTTTESPSPETTEDETVPVTMTTVVPATTEGSNLTDKDGASGGGTIERASSSESNKRKEAWAAILGTAVAVCVVALVIYIILKKKNQKDFSHRKLVEFSSDPVLRLDNSEPLDLAYGRGAYYNPALQTDNFQMTSMPSQYN